MGRTPACSTAIPQENAEGLSCANAPLTTLASPLLCVPRGPPENAPGERFHGPIAAGRKPAGKGPSPSLTAVIRPRLPGRARNRACQGQAGAAGFDAGQIRQEGRGRCLPTGSREFHLARMPLLTLTKTFARQSQYVASGPGSGFRGIVRCTPGISAQPE
jgi:hypothetical protein